MIDGLTLVLLAIVGGFCSSAPLGAINLWITDAVLEKHEERIRWFIFGVITADACLGALASWGYHAFLEERGIDAWLAVAGGAFLVVLGLLGLRKKEPAAGKPERVSRIHRPVQGFLLGLFMCGANPAFLVFWVFVIAQIERHAGLVVTDSNLAMFVTGIAFGDGLWFLTLIAVARRGREAVTPKLLSRARVGIASAFVLAGLVAIYKGVA